MRDVVLSGVAGFLASCGGGFVIHRSIWKTADAQAQAIEELSPTYRRKELEATPPPVRSISITKHRASVYIYIHIF